MTSQPVWTVIGPILASFCVVSPALARMRGGAWIRHMTPPSIPWGAQFRVGDIEQGLFPFSHFGTRALRSTRDTFKVAQNHFVCSESAVFIGSKVRDFGFIQKGVLRGVSG